MGLLEIVLTAVSTSADAIAISEYLRDKAFNETSLLERCFRLSVTRHAPRLERFSGFNDLASINVKSDELGNAVSALNTLVDLGEILGAGSYPNEVLDAFSAAIEIPESCATPNELRPITAQILKAAFQDFVHRLPTETVAVLNAVVLSNRMAQDRHQEIVTILNQLASKASEMPYLDPTLVQQESSRPNYRNPFRIVKAEEFDHNYALLAQLFNAPETYDQICGPGNLVLEGGRGCGKSMILRSMSVRAAVHVESIRRNGAADPPPELQFKDAGLEYFGVYIKLARGYFHEWDPDAALTQSAATQLFEHSFNMLLLRSLLDTLSDARNAHVITLNGSQESTACRSIAELIAPDASADNIVALRRLIGKEEHSVRTYLGQVRLGQEPIYLGNYTSAHEFLAQVCEIVRGELSDLNGARIFFLLDEYENLAEFQQTVVNTIAKLRPASLTLKIATRPCGVKSIADLNREQIQRPRDYEVVPLDYDVHSSKYSDLLRKIAAKRLMADGYAVTDLAILLECAPRYHPSDEDKVTAALKRMLLSDGLSDKEIEVKWKEKLHQFEEALIFRTCKTSRQPRTYAGLNDFVSLSSGIISNFLELCKTAFYLAEGEGVRVKRGDKIPWEIQNRAIYYVSKSSFDYISRNVEEVGPRLSRMIQDLADIFRAKLLNHGSEPEAARLKIADPENIETDECQLLRATMQEAMKWSIVHSPGSAMSYLPKHSTETRSTDFYLNRILSPILRISHRPRWGTRFHARDLRSLLAEDTRTATRKALLNRHAKPDASKGRPLLNEEEGFS